MATKVTARFRYNAALPIGAFVALCGTVPLTAGGWPFAFVLLVPAAVVLWGWRAGVDVRAGRLVVRWAIGSRTLEPGEIRGFTITYRRVCAVLADERTVWLPAVPGTRLPVLAEAVGLRMAGVEPAETTADEAAPDGEPADANTNVERSGDEPSDGDPTGAEGTVARSTDTADAMRADGATPDDERRAGATGDAEASSARR